MNDLDNISDLDLKVKFRFWQFLIRFDNGEALLSGIFFQIKSNLRRKYANVFHGRSFTAYSKCILKIPIGNFLESLLLPTKELLSCLACLCWNQESFLLELNKLCVLDLSLVRASSFEYEFLRILGECVLIGSTNLPNRLIAVNI